MDIRIRLFQVCGQVDDRDRPTLRIRLDKTEFTFGSEDYVRQQHTPLEWYDIKKHKEYGFIVYCGTTPLVKEKVKDPVYKPPKPQYPNIGV